MPAAIPDPLALLILIATITTALALRLGPFKLMGGGAVIGVLRGQLPLQILGRSFLRSRVRRGSLRFCQELFSSAQRSTRDDRGRRSAQVSDDYEWRLSPT
jgi:hypothetical protein